MTSKTLLRSELEVLKQKFEEWTGNKITDESLDNAIAVYNENRRLLREVNVLRRTFNVPILGSEAMNLLLADQVMDKAEMNGILIKFLKELEGRVPYPDKIRLMLVGSETWNADLETLIENLGANVVIDELDNGSAYWWNDVVYQQDRLMSIGLRYLGRPHSALKDNNWRRRPQHIHNLIEDYGVDGVIIAKQIYCHPHGTDNYAVWKALRERYIPYHFLERDMSVPQDETRQRIEAFLNMLRPGLVRLKGWHTPLEI
jgi:benzoyl-CoA reductase/2-hydroxyglutaryl-CoA dehydratase subunit BcrC/BadD/HgdB